MLHLHRRLLFILRYPGDQSLHGKREEESSFINHTETCLQPKYFVWLKQVKLKQGNLEHVIFQTVFPVCVKDMTQLKMNLETTLYSCGQMELEAFEQSEISYFIIDLMRTTLPAFCFSSHANHSMRNRS